MRKGGTTVLVISAIVILCGIGVIVGGFVSVPGYHVVRQGVNGLMVSMRYPSPTGSSLPLMLTILGSSLLVVGVLLLSLGLYLLVQGRKQEPAVRVTEKKMPRQSAAQKPEPAAKEAEVIDVEEQK
jgi:hypothetical protein